MTYNSLIDPIFWDNFKSPKKNCPRSMKYKGTLEKTLNTLEKLAYKPKLNKKEFIFYPPRVIRAVLDYKIKNSATMKNSVEVINAATNLALSIYQNPENTRDQIDLFRHTLEDTKNQEILDFKVYQIKDWVTWSAYNPEYSEDSAKRILNKFGRKNIFFIPIAHGGIAAGLDVFLRYSELSKAKNSIIYPVRFSRAKHGDRFPQINEEEKHYLKKKSFWKKIVVFDEDSSSGITLIKSDLFFENMFEKRIFCETNLTL